MPSIIVALAVMVGVMGAARLVAGLDTAGRLFDLQWRERHHRYRDSVRVAVWCFGVLAFSLASALCLRASSVAPVRGDA
ncbi:hypothetical protein [Paraburkholderia hospita]|jgi:hypothetical protein|uniref:hypothetical protein n=1 Tax=Paraburkholderia hospita TaxID=169430 RepID=UPI0005555195|nr:hypothetical protein [Paraburkholderia hospita]